jgi:uncharacterized membrane protein
LIAGSISCRGLKKTFAKTIIACNLRNRKKLVKLLIVCRRGEAKVNDSNKIEEKQSSGTSIPFNYAIIIFGCILFPLTILSAFISKRRIKTENGWEKSHWVFQYYTSIVFLILMSTFSVAIISLFIFLPNADTAQSVSKGMTITAVSNVVYIIYGWVLVRSARGIYLSGAKRKILNPETLWLWPRTQH